MPVEASAPNAVPTLQDVAMYCGRSETAGLEDAYNAELAAQAAACRVDPYTDDLAEALRRRVKRNLAMRALPLGVQQSEMGGTAVGTYDPEVRRLERPHRRLVVG